MPTAGWAIGTAFLLAPWLGLGFHAHRRVGDWNGVSGQLAEGMEQIVFMPTAGWAIGTLLKNSRALARVFMPTAGWAIGTPFSTCSHSRKFRA